MKKILEYKIYLIIAAVVIVVIAIIYFIGRRAGKKSADNPWQAPLPSDDGSGAVDAAKVRTISDDLYADLSKWDWNPLTMTRNVEIYKKFNSLSDTEFVAVYNDFNSRFSSKFKGKSLRVIIKDEIGWGLSQFNVLRDTIEQRFNRLGLV